MLWYIFSPMIRLTKTLYPFTSASAPFAKFYNLLLLRYILNREWKAVLLPQAEKKPKHPLQPCSSVSSHLPTSCARLCLSVTESLIGRMRRAVRASTGCAVTSAMRPLSPGSGTTPECRPPPPLPPLPPPRTPAGLAGPSPQDSALAGTVSSSPHLLLFLLASFQCRMPTCRKLTRTKPTTLLQPKSATRCSSWMWQSEESQSTWSRSSTPSRCPTACSTAFTSHTPVGRR